MFDKISNKSAVLLAAFSGLLFAAGSLRPETLFCQSACLLSITLFVLALRAEKKVMLISFSFGLCFHLLAFNWIPYTLGNFGGFPAPLTYALFLVFALLSSLQFLIFAWILKICRRAYSGIWLVPLVWTACEYSIPKLFPWTVSHTQIYWSSFSASADLVGIYPLSGVLFLWAEVLTRFLAGERSKWFFIVIILSVALLGYGFLDNAHYKTLVSKAPKVKVAVVQGNLSTEEKGDIKLLAANLERYQRLSKKAIEAGAELIIWPESVVNKWLPLGTKHLIGNPADPMPGIERDIIYGGLSYKVRDKKEYERYLKNVDNPSKASRFKYNYFNSAFHRKIDGSIGGLYHKKILMPFGEYMPFGDKWPKLYQLSPHTGNFTAGKERGIFSIQLPENKNVHAGIMVCYEDMVPNLPRRLIKSSSGKMNLLINLTNDAWYGDSAAPKQHHLLAMWRAIELRRSFIRSTNTGYTAIVDPFGKTTHSLKPFSEGLILADVPLLEEKTVYSSIGDMVSLFLVVLLIFLLANAIIHIPDA